MQRPDGSTVRFEDNACVLVNKSGDPIGTRLTGQCFLLGLFLWIHSVFGYVLNAMLTRSSHYRCCCVGTTRETMVKDTVLGSCACIKKVHFLKENKFCMHIRSFSSSAFPQRRRRQNTDVEKYQCNSRMQRKKETFQVIVMYRHYRKRSKRSTISRLTSASSGKRIHVSFFLTIPVSADRCCDWKKTASCSPQLGHILSVLGSYEEVSCQSKMKTDDAPLTTGKEIIKQRIDKP